MTLESVLYYCTHHSETIIQWLFFGILLLSALVIARTMFGKRDVETSVAAAGAGPAMFADGSDIQTFLKKILDQTTKLEGVKLEGLAPAALGDLDTQVQALKKDLAAREDEIAKLKAAGPPAAVAAVDTGGLSSRIKELETKLAEYEILEDDIADLSLYKEENVRLRTELDKLKTTGAPVNAPGEVAPQAPAPEASSAAPPDPADMLAELTQAVAPASAPTPPPVSPQPSAVEMPLPNTGDPMTDFEQAVNLEKKLTGTEAIAPAAPPEAPAPVAAPPPDPAPAAAAAAPAAEAEGDDLFAEFVTAAPEESLDTDKMMEEMAALVNMESGQKGSALQEEMDTDKLAAEATRLVKS